MSREKRQTKKMKLSAVCLLATLVTAALFTPALALPVRPQDTIVAFEQGNPVYSEKFSPGTPLENLLLPDVLRAVLRLSEEIPMESFSPSKPIADWSDGYEMYDYFRYGYIAPSDGSGIYRMTYPDGEISYRIFGSVNGGDARWYSSDEEGVIDGEIANIPVTWESTGYDPDTEGEYIFNATIEGYIYSEARPYAVISIEETDDARHDEELSRECTCGVQEGDVHAVDCPLYDPTVSFVTPSSLNGGGPNDVAMDTYITSSAPTTGQTAWVNYLNTIWMNKAMSMNLARPGFAWTPDSAMTGLGVNSATTGLVEFDY